MFERPYHKSRTIWGLQQAPDFRKLPYRTYVGLFGDLGISGKFVSGR